MLINFLLQGTMDSIKKKMEKLANETAEAEARIANYESIKAANEADQVSHKEENTRALL